MRSFSSLFPELEVQTKATTKALVCTPRLFLLCNWKFKFIPGWGCRDGTGFRFCFWKWFLVLGFVSVLQSCTIVLLLHDLATIILKLFFYSAQSWMLLHLADGKVLRRCNLLAAAERSVVAWHFSTYDEGSFPMEKGACDELWELCALYVIRGRSWVWVCVQNRISLTCNLLISILRLSW